MHGDLGNQLLGDYAYGSPQSVALDDYDNPLLEDFDGLGMFVDCPDQPSAQCLASVTVHYSDLPNIDHESVTMFADATTTAR